jgi:hypothetical protein
MLSQGPLHQAGTTLLSLAMAAIGVALVVQSVADHAGIVSGRFLLGILFFAAGCGRLWLTVLRRDRRSAEPEEAGRRRSRRRRRAL